MTEQEQAPTFEGWAILELMGHRRLAGFVTEVELAGHGMIRLDVPGYLHAERGGEEVGEATQFYSPGALYCLTPTTEETARRIAASERPRPVNEWDFRPRPALGVGERARDDEDIPF